MRDSSVNRVRFRLTNWKLSCLFAWIRSDANFPLGHAVLRSRLKFEKGELNRSGKLLLQVSPQLSPEMLQKMNAYWRAANYLSVGQIYLYDNPLLEAAAGAGRCGSTCCWDAGHDPGQNFIYVHLNRVIKKYDLDMIYVSVRGCGPTVVGNVYLEIL